MSNKSHDPADVSRRTVLGAAVTGAVALGAPPAAPAASAPPAGPAAKLQYLTPVERFRTFVREKPPIDRFPPEKLREVGLDRDTWQLDVVPEEGGDVRIGRPLSKAAGTALSFAALMKLAEKSAVRFLKALTCTNLADIQGMGLWEGVPLREIIWLARPAANIRRVYYYGYHNDDDRQRFVSSLPLARVLEDAPWDLPVILCYKLNGQWLPPRLGGPVRLIVPEAYGNKAVKWLQRVVLTNSYQANDTYAQWNNDVESPMKSFARFISPPARAGAGQPVMLEGMAQVGVAGLSKVQYALHPQDAPLPADDPGFAGLDWRDARILPPPADWGGGLPDGRLPPGVFGFDDAGRPRAWPLRYTICHWQAELTDLRPGRYHIRCRAIDGNGLAQPLPRPIGRSGVNAIQQAALTVE